jgi:RND family efflux transporter MFP subunit
VNGPVKGRSLILASVVALGLLAAACGGGDEEEATTPEGALVQIVEAAPASAAGAIRASGLVGYRREPALSFAAPGVVEAIFADDGDTVRRGQRLATIRRISVGANADEAALAQANAERDLERTQALFDAGFVSEARLEDARLAVERSRGASVLTAPANGVILRRVAEPAQTVAAGAPIVIFGETGSGLVVRASMASFDASRIRVGDRATVRVSEVGEATREGRVTRVGAKGADGTGAFEVEVEIANTQGLRSGMVGEVEVLAQAQAGAAPTASAILVPALSLLDARADQGAVYVVDAQNVAHRRTVRTAGVTEAGVIIVEGIQPGDRIVAAGAAYVRDGETVRIAAAE